MNRNKKTLVLILILLILCTGISVSYAYFKVSNSSSGKAVVTVNGAPLCMTLQLKVNNISIKDAYAVPVSDAKALSSTVYKTTLTIENKCTSAQSFKLLAVPGPSNTMPIGAIKYALVENGATVPSTGQILSDSYALDSTIKKQLSQILNNTSYKFNIGYLTGTGTVAAGTTKTYNLYLWIDENEGGLGNNVTMGKTLSTYLALATGNTIGEEVVATNSLYKTIENRYTLGNSYVKKYGDLSGEDGASTYANPVYYFNGAVEDNNVLFAGFCWKIVRTTDTGGIKMIYNGVPTEIAATSPVEESEYTNVTNDATYPYTFDSSNKTWTSTNHDDNSESSISFSVATDGDYYFNYVTSTEPQVDEASFSKNGTEFAYGGGEETNTVKLTGLTTSDVIKVSYRKDSSISDGSDTVTFSLSKIFNNCNNSGDASQLASTKGFNSSNNSPAYVGYMNNKVYAYSTKSLISSLIINGLKIVGNSVTYSGGTYTLKNTSTVSVSSDNTNISEMVGKYTCNDSSAISCSSPYYIVGYNRTTIYYYKLSGGNTDGTSYSKDYVFGNSFTYANGTYTLSDTVAINSDTWISNISSNTTSIKTHHYTCFTDGTTCTSIYYIHYISNSTPYYITLTNGKSVEDALNEMLYADDVNKNDSTIKTYIDSWYKDKMTSYTDKLEDTVFCNDRTIKAKNGWEPGGSITSTSFLQFKNYNTNYSLACTNETDRFSMSNSKARLNYPVGLLSTPEVYLAYRGASYSTYYLKTGSWYWLASPYYFTNTEAKGMYVNKTGDMGWRYLSTEMGVRPVISLKPGTEYTSGDGAYTNPFVVE